MPEDEELTIEQVKKWLAAWAEDQAYIAEQPRMGDAARQQFRARAEALADAARDITRDNIWSLAGFIQSDGSIRNA